MKKSQLLHIQNSSELDVADIQESSSTSYQSQIQALLISSIKIKSLSIKTKENMY